MRLFLGLFLLLFNILKTSLLYWYVCASKYLTWIRTGYLVASRCVYKVWYYNIIVVKDIHGENIMRKLRCHNHSYINWILKHLACESWACSPQITFFVCERWTVADTHIYRGNLQHSQRLFHILFYMSFKFVWGASSHLNLKPNALKLCTNVCEIQSTFISWVSFKFLQFTT